MKHIKNSKIKLSDFATVIMGQSPSSNFYNEVGKGLPFFQGVTDFGYKYPNETCWTTVAPKKAEINDVLFSVRAPVGDVNIANKKCCIGRGIAAIRSKTNQVDYLYYLLKYQSIKIQRLGTGAVYDAVKKSDLENIFLDVSEDTNTQFKIGGSLVLYDDLIDTNRRRIQLLEESARLLFREWFVYFRFPLLRQGFGGQAGYEKACPVESRNSTGVKIIGGVPEGWKRINFMDIISTVESGGRPRGGAIDEGIPSIGAENVNGIGNYDYSNEKYVPAEYYQKMKKGKVISKDVLLYKDGANIGRTTIVGYGFPHNICCVNEHVFILRTKNNIQNWLYFFISQDFIRQAVANLNSNSAQPGISQDKLSSLKIIFPDEEIVRLFDDVTESIVKQIFTLSIQNQKLAQARDLLLPRLMSGAIEV